MTRKAAENSEYDQYLLRLGARIKEYRLERGWSQHYVCKTFDFYESHWRLLEQGKVISVPSLYKIAKMYGIDPSALLAGLYHPDVAGNASISTEQSKSVCPVDSGEALSKIAVSRSKI